MAKRFTFAILATLMVISLVLIGCQSTPAPTTTSAPATTSAAPTTTAAPAAFKFTKPISIILHLGPGSSYDTYARGIAPYLAKYTGVDVVVKNVTGAAGLTGALQLWREKPDGYNIGLFDMERFVSYQMVAKMEFDVKKFEWVNIPATGYYVLGVAKDSPYKTVKDVVAASLIKPVRFVTTEVGTTEVITTAVTGMKTTYVINTTGGADSITALMKGEGDIRVVTDSMMAPFIKSGDIRGIMFYSDKPSTILSTTGAPAIPTAIDAGYPELAYLSGPRGFLLPPGTPPEIIAAYEAAFNQAYKDQALIDWGIKANAPIMPRDRTETIKALNGLFDLYQKYADLLKQYIKL